MKPVVSKDDPVSLAICPTCRGSALFVISKFVSDDDRADMARLADLGYLITSKALSKASSIDECQCSPQKIAAAPKPAAPAPKATGKPVLSLRRKA